MQWPGSESSSEALTPIAPLRQARPPYERPLRGLVRDQDRERACRHLIYCSAVLSPAPKPTAQAESRDPSDGRTGQPLPSLAKILLIVERVDGFVLQRLTDRGEHVGDTQHDTLDEAMSYAYSEYNAISDWRFCPDDDPLEYIQGQSDP